jgi:predicted RNA-binding protein YlxR (DUF448 family)/ribosomal protein L7Ae-like RNA K-turn-binding protein
MIEAVEHVNSGEPTRGPGEARRARTRTCVGCAERVRTDGPDGADLIRLILGPGGEIAVDPKGGGFGRGAHVHARPACVERAARAGLLRATKGTARVVRDGEREEEAGSLRADSLARAIQRSMDRRIEGLLAASVRSRRFARGADAVTGACQRGEAALVLLACDAAAAANLTEVRRAVTEGRAVAWGTKERLGAIVAPGTVRGRLRAPPGSPPDPAGVGVVAVTSRALAEALRRAVQAVDAMAPVAAAVPTSTEAPRRARRARGHRSDG